MPRERLERVNRSIRRRFDDIIEDAFHHACMTGDLDTAIELTELLERKLARWRQAHGTDSRQETPQLNAMREEIALRLQERGEEPG